MNKFSIPLNAKNFLTAMTAVTVLWLPVLWLHLTIVLWCALITYGATTNLTHFIQQRLPKLRAVKLISVFIVVLCIVISFFILGDWLGSKVSKITPSSISELSTKILDQLHTILPAAIAEHLPISVDTLKSTVTQFLKNHASELQIAGAHAIRGLSYAIIGIAIGAIATIQLPRKVNHSSGPLVTIMHDEFNELLTGFTDVFFAQVRISIINTLFTSIYLLLVLPLIGPPLPFTGTVIAITFVAGLIPVVGNLISNTIIVLLSIPDGLWITIMSLGFLIGIHKGEYFLNAHIIGNRIHAKAWELLIIMVVMQAAFGIAGLVSAPIIYAQIKRSLARRQWV